MEDHYTEDTCSTEALGVVCIGKVLTHCSEVFTVILKPSCTLYFTIKCLGGCLPVY